MIYETNSTHGVAFIENIFKISTFLGILFRRWVRRDHRIWPIEWWWGSPSKCNFSSSKAFAQILLTFSLHFQENDQQHYIVIANDDGIVNPNVRYPWYACRNIKSIMFPIAFKMYEELECAINKPIKVTSSRAKSRARLAVGN